MNGKCSTLNKWRRRGVAKQCRKSGRRGVLVCLLGFVLLVPGVPGSALAGSTGTVVWFLEQEPGIDPYPVRYLVTPEFMRSDDGRDDGDFLLYDRGQRRIYSVARDNRTVLEIDGEGPVPRAPDELALSVSEHVDGKAPRIDGHSPVELELRAGDEVCQSALVAPGFLEPVRAALQEYNRTLAVQQWRTLNRTPAQFRTPCFLSRYLYATDFHLARGMVLADWDKSGKRRELTRYQSDVSLDASLFVVPGDFRVIRAAGD